MELQENNKKRSRDDFDNIQADQDQPNGEEEKEDQFKQPRAKRAEVQNLTGEDEDAIKNTVEELGVFEFPWEKEKQKDEEKDNDLHVGEEAFYSSLLGVAAVHDHLPAEGLCDGLLPSSPVIFPGEKMEDEWWATPDMEGVDCMHVGA